MKKKAKPNSLHFFPKSGSALIPQACSFTFTKVSHQLFGPSSSCFLKVNCKRLKRPRTQSQWRTEEPEMTIFSFFMCMRFSCLWSLSIVKDIQRWRIEGQASGKSSKWLSSSPSHHVGYYRTKPSQKQVDAVKKELRHNHKSSAVRQKLKIKTNPTGPWLGRISAASDGAPPNLDRFEWLDKRGGHRQVGTGGHDWHDAEKVTQFYFQ